MSEAKAPDRNVYPDRELVQLSDRIGRIEAFFTSTNGSSMPERLKRVEQIAESIQTSAKVAAESAVNAGKQRIKRWQAFACMAVIALMTPVFNLAVERFRKIDPAPAVSPIPSEFLQRMERLQKAVDAIDKQSVDIPARPVRRRRVIPGSGAFDFPPTAPKLYPDLGLMQLPSDGTRE